MGKAVQSYWQFQHTAARRRLVVKRFTGNHAVIVSTHSRPKAAGVGVVCAPFAAVVSTHSRPKAAGELWLSRAVKLKVSTHSRPKAAG